jgi:hypothetical protein
MKPFTQIAAGLGLLSLAGWMMMAPPEAVQAQKKERASPHETKTWTIGGKKITITYGRPFKKGRVIFGGLEPWGKVWRTGADEATVFETEGDLMIGDLHVTAGSYSLFTIPNEKEWTLVLNKTVKQWGAFKYDPLMDYGRTPMKVAKAASPAEQLTIEVESKGGSQGVLKIAWDETVASVPVMVH